MNKKKKTDTSKQASEGKAKARKPGHTIRKQKEASQQAMAADL